MRSRESWKIALWSVGFGLACSAPEPGDEMGDETAVEVVEETGLPQSNPVFEFDFVPKNLLFLAFDTTRLDRLTPEIAPTISSLLDQSVQFPQHRACSNWTYLSFGCALTGRSNIAQDWVPEGFLDLKDGDEKTPYPEGPYMMAERFSDAGFQTVITGTHPLLDEKYNLFQGYQRRATFIYEGGDNVAQKALTLAQDLMDAGKPWMMHVHFDDPHIPYTIREEYLPELDDLPEMDFDFEMRDIISAVHLLWPTLDGSGKENLLTNLNAIYNSEIRFMDAQLAILWEKLEAMGALEDTLVVLFSDHGEQFFEHEKFTHGATLHTEETSSLLAFWHAGLPPQKLDWKTTNEDVLPTLLHFFGLENEDTDGLVLTQLESPPTRPVFGVHADRPASTQQSVRRGDDYLIYWWKGFAKRYDLSQDPGELSDLYGQDPQGDQALMDLLSGEIEALSLIHPHRTPVPLE